MYDYRSTTTSWRLSLSNVRKTRSQRMVRSAHSRRRLSIRRISSRSSRRKSVELEITARRLRKIFRLWTINAFT